jgi:glycosyltransferase involved in cell wall biosynthesis
MKVTVFVPTYNRAHLLPTLYNSLIKQTYQNFEFLIVDDGSTDNTKELVEQWISQGNITIRYYNQDNQGKHFAYNRAIKEAQGDLFVDIDSDDFFRPNALEIVVTHWTNLSNKHEFASIQTLCCNENNDIIGTKFAKEISTQFEIRYIDKVRGDKGMFYNLNYLKNHSLPEIPKEYVLESILHNRVNHNLKSLCINKALIVKDYLPDGISARKTTVRSSINAYIILYNELNCYKLTISQSLHFNSRYIKLSLINDVPIKEVFAKSMAPSIPLIVAFIMGSLSYLKFKIKDKPVASPTST